MLVSAALCASIAVRQCDTIDDDDGSATVVGDDRIERCIVEGA